MLNKKITYICILILVCIMQTVQVYSKTPELKQIPNRALIIGIYLIDFDALTKEVYDLAKNSANENQQPNIYYKSEFADGTWFDITKGDSINSVMSEKGKVVSVSDITAVVAKLKYWAHSSGQIEDLVSGNANVSLSDLYKLDSIGKSKPEDLNEMKSLIGEKKALEKLANQDGIDDKDKENYEAQLAGMNRVLENFKSDAYNDMANQLNNMDKYMSHIKKDLPDKKDEFLDMLTPLNEQLKLKKDIQAYKELKTRVQNELDAATKNCPDLVSKLSSTPASLNNKLGELENKLATRPTGILEQEKWDLEQKLVESINKNDFPTADKLLNKICTLDALAKGRPVAKNNALPILKDLKAKVMKNYLDKASKANSDEYNKALKNGESSNVLNSIKDKETKELKDLYAQKEQLNALIAQVSGGDIQAKKDILTEDKAKLTEQLAAMSNGGAKDKIALLNEQLNALNEQLNKLLTQQAGQTATNKDIKDKIKGLQEQKLGLLEKNDLAGAKAVDSQINDLSKQLDKLAQDTANKIVELTKQKNVLENNIDKSSDKYKVNEAKQKIDDINQQIAKAIASLPDGIKQALSTVDENKKELLKALGNKDIKGAQQALDTIKTANESVPPNMKDILKDKNTQNKAEQLTQGMLATASANQDSNGAQQLNTVLVAIKEVFEDSAKSPLAENIEKALKNLDSALGSSQQALKDTLAKLEKQRDDLKDTLLNIADSSNLSAVEKVLADLSNVVKQIADNKKELLFAKLDNIAKLSKDPKNIPDMLEALGAIKSDVISQLKDIEKAKYTPEELKQIEEKAKAITATDSKISTLPVDSVISRGMYIKLSEPPIKKDGELFIAARAVYEVFKAKVHWSNDQNRKAVITTDDKEIVLQIGNLTATVNGQPSKLDKCPELINERTYAPLKFIAQSLGFEYEWLEKENVVMIKAKGKQENFGERERGILFKPF